jgi:protocatechuate 3,4-dioxygenase beta subunit
VHIHFKIRVPGPGGTTAPTYEFTSQLYFDDALNDKVMALSPYAGRGSGRISNERDGIFRRGGKQLMLAVTETPNGYDGVFHVGVKLA